MNVTHLHPEELLDKDARRTLSPEAGVRLDAHMAGCAACVFARAVRDDFAAELEADEAAPVLLDVACAALASPEAAPKMARAPSPQSAGTGSPALMSKPDAATGLGRRSRQSILLFLVVAAVMAVSAAGATALPARAWVHLLAGGPNTTHGDFAGTYGSPPASHTAFLRSRAVPASSSGSSLLAPQPVSSRDRLPAATRPMAARAPVAPSRVRAGQPARTTAGGLFDSANAARRTGDTAAALARYEALELDFPASAEARLVKATIARLLLDRGDLIGALAGFDGHLLSSAPELREEAMAGRAIALERLGRTDDEVRAWTTLVRTFPSAPYAAHAQSRIASFSPR